MIIEDNRSGLIEMVDLAVPLGMAVVSVECRLAPETPHPGPVEDCYAGLAWLSAHAARAGDLSGLPPTFGVEPPSGFEPDTYAVPGGSLMVFHPGAELGFWSRLTSLDQDGPRDNCNDCCTEGRPPRRRFRTP